MEHFQPDYSRQTRLQGFGEQGQAKLAAARVLVIGAGGLGSPVIPLLAGAGVGQLTIVDHDTLDASNLHRQTLYGFEDIGQFKAELAVRAIQKLNPTIKTVAICHKLNAAELLEQLEKHTLIVECSDDFANKLMVNDAAVLLGKPAVFASAVQREGQLQTWTGESDCACLRCLWKTVPGSTQSCEETGVLGSVPAFIGALQATEVLQMLLGESPEFFYRSLKNRVLVYDAATYQQRLMKFSQASDCPLHQASYSRQQFLQEHQPMEFTGSFDDAIEQGFNIVDIRDAQTATQQPLPVPNIRIAAEQLLNHPDIDLEQPVLLVCYMGRTSLGVTAQLREMGYERVFSKARGAAGE